MNRCLGRVVVLGLFCVLCYELYGGEQFFVVLVLWPSLAMCSWWWRWCWWLWLWVWMQLIRPTVFHFSSRETWNVTHLLIHLMSVGQCQIILLSGGGTCELSWDIVTECGSVGCRLHRRDAVRRQHKGCCDTAGVDGDGRLYQSVFSRYVMFSLFGGVFRRQMYVGKYWSTAQGTHGLSDSGLYNVFRLVVVTKVTYVSSASSGFANKHDVQRIDAFLRCNKKCGLCQPDFPLFQELWHYRRTALWQSSTKEATPSPLLASSTFGFFTILRPPEKTTESATSSTFLTPYGF